MTLHLGQATIRGSIDHYSKFFDLFELSSQPGKLPRAPVLRRWRQSVPQEFVFAVSLPSSAASLGEGGRGELQRALDAANILDARWLVVKTPRSFTPTIRHREQLRALVEQLKGNAQSVAWQAEGIWEAAEAEELAAELDICWVADLGRDELPARERVYARLRSLGSGGRVGGGVLERAAERLAECQEAHVILEGNAAGITARRLRDATMEFRGNTMEASLEFSHEDEDGSER